MVTIAAEYQFRSATTPKKLGFDIKKASFVAIEMEIKRHTSWPSDEWALHSTPRVLDEVIAIEVVKPCIPWLRTYYNTKNTNLAQTLKRVLDSFNN